MVVTPGMAVLLRAGASLTLAGVLMTARHGESWIDRFRWAMREHGALGVWGALLRKLWRELIWARDDVYVYVLNRSTRLPDLEPAADSRPRLVLKRGELADLIRLAPESHGFLDHDRLEKARQRLGHDDAVYLAYDGDRVAHIAWVGTRTRIQAGYEVGEECWIDLPHPVSVIYDCWTPPEFRGHGIYPRVLSMLSREALERHPAVWIYCLKDNVASRRGILKAGFEHNYRMTRLRSLGVTRSFTRESGELPG